ncbi:fungal-specific transcription factor domain-containing protein [Obelidium mucronatum]|nr:fungal-specific transcription factor domain-containing protein [Obelidium mucronatum]
MESRNSESPLLLNAMYALAARYSNHPSILSLGSMFGGPVTSLDEVKQRACDVFYFKARDLVDQYMDFAKVSTIAAFLLLKSLCAASGRISASWMYSGMAISMLKEMRRGSNSDDNALTSESDASLDWLEREKRRRLWWMCYVGDRFAAAASDRPMIMQDADCKVHFPASNEDWVAGFPAIPDNPATVEEKKRQIVDFSSSSAFIPNLSSQTYHGYYILLSKIYGQIIEFTKVYKTTGGLSEMVAAVAASTNTNLLLPGASAASAAASTTRSQVIDQTDLQLSLLETSLKSWHAFLPESYRALNYDALLSAPNANRKEIYIRANLQIYYRLCLIFLHKPKLMNLLRTTPPLRHHATIPKTTSFITCQQAALEITQILNMIRGPDGESGPNPQLTHFYPFAPCFAIFQSALVHLMAGQVACGAGMSGVQKATVHAIALKGLSRCWGLAGKLHSSLVGLIDVARESAMSGGDVVPCGDHCLDAVPASSGIGRGPSASATTAAPPSTAIPNPRVGNAAASSASTMHGLNSMLGLGLHSGFGSFGGMGGFMMPGSGIRVGRAESSANAPGQARIEEVFDTDAVGGGTGIIPANASVGNMSSMNGGAMSRPNLNNMWGFNADLNGGSGGSSFSPSAGGGVSSSSNTLNGNLTQGSAARHSTTANQQFQPPQQQQPQHQQHGQQRNQQPNQQQPQQLQQQMPFYNQQQNQILNGNSGANPNPNNPNMISIENNPMWNLLNSPFGDFNSANGFL